MLQKSSVNKGFVAYRIYENYDIMHTENGGFENRRSLVRTVFFCL